MWVFRHVEFRVFGVLGLELLDLMLRIGVYGSELGV